MRDRLDSDPLASIVALLRPRTVLSKFVGGAGKWAVQYPNYGQPSFCLMLKGACWLNLDGVEPFLMEPGDYVLLPATPGFRMGSDLDALERPTMRIPDATPAGEILHGQQENEPAVRMLGDTSCSTLRTHRFSWGSSPRSSTSRPMTLAGNA